MRQSEPRRLVACSALAAALLTGRAAVGHHSFAQFQMDKEVRVHGTVKSFEWTNPHTWLTISAADSRGGVSEWRLEGASVNEFARAGWTKHVLNPGDPVTAAIHPLRSGDPGGAFFSITTAAGRTFNQKTKEQQQP